MNSPFTDQLINTGDYQSLSSQTNELESFSPFSKDCGCTQEIGVNNFLQEEEVWGADELRKATLLNDQYKLQYKWGEYLPQILAFMEVNVLSWPAMLNMENFTKAFAEWQKSHGFSSNLKGVFGLNNWTYFQKKIGLNNLSNVHNINVGEATRNNNYYKSQLWKIKQKPFFNS
ncbi:MAG: hypothetical protein IPP79_07145 [Chitinophagaceae bacterium]|nr:hypothetical protein [Chitinophagaceae bacterium]